MLDWLEDEITTVLGWRFKAQYFNLVWHFYQAVMTRSFMTPSPMRVWSDGVQALHVTSVPPRPYLEIPEVA